MKLIVITTPHFFPGEGEILTALFEAGMERLHLRKPECEEAALRALLDSLPAVYHPRIVLHEHFELANRYSIGGIHLNRRNPVAPAGFKGSISRSCHSITELKEHSERDYLFLSPIFESISKIGYGNGFPPETLREASAAGLINERVIALGGISPDTLPKLRPFAFGGVAVLGALWGECPSLKEKNTIIERYKRFAKMLSTMYTDTYMSLAGKSRLMFITHRTDRYTELDEVKRVIAGGCDWIQLRVKNGLTPELAQAVSHYVNGCEGCCCCLDDNLELALQTGFHCVHLGKHDMPVDEARKRVREAGKEGQFLIGATANTFEDIVKAVRSGADYIGLGPYRFTTTKEKLSPILGLEGYRTLIRQCRETGIQIPIFAIGGIRFEDIEPLMQAGVDGIAVSGALIQAEDPTEETRRYIREIRRCTTHPSCKSIK